ncbi:MAG: DUF1294 domain-containing protein [Clostridia bacterium]|nr:DUF1294 domain-containing protein [Clostridia bacterium]
MKAYYLLLIYFSAINFITFLLFLIDKIKAVKGSWRISEKNLILCSILGGALGGIAAMILFNHKTKKLKFLISLPLILIFYFLIFLPLFFNYFL